MSQEEFIGDIYIHVLPHGELDRDKAWGYVYQNWRQTCFEVVFRPPFTPCFHEYDLPINVEDGEGMSSLVDIFQGMMKYQSNYTGAYMAHLDEQLFQMSEVPESVDRQEEAGWFVVYVEHRGTPKVWAFSKTRDQVVVTDKTIIRGKERIRHRMLINGEWRQKTTKFGEKLVDYLNYCDTMWRLEQASKEA